MRRTHRDFFDRMEAIRLKAGKAMGIGDVSKSATQKVAVLAPSRDGGTFSARHLMPLKTHPIMAVTSAQCIASCALSPGTVANGMLDRPLDSPAEVVPEHACRSIDVLVDFSSDGAFTLNAAGLVQTARRMADGKVYVPRSLRAGSEGDA